MKLFLMGLLIAAGPQWLSSSVAKATATIDQGSAIALASGIEVEAHPHPAHGEYVVRKAKRGGKAHTKTFVVKKHDGDGPKVIKKRIKLNKSGKGCDSCKKCKNGCWSAKKKSKGCRCGNSFVVKKLHGGKGNVFVFDDDDESGNVRVEVILDGDGDSDIKWFGKGHGAKAHAFAKKMHGGHAGMFFSGDDDDDDDENVFVFSGNGGGCCGKGHNFAKMFGDGHGLHSVMETFGHGFSGGNVKFKSLGGDGDAKAFMIVIGDDDEGENVFKFNCRKGGKGCCGKCKKGSKSDVSFGGDFDFDFDFGFDVDAEVDVQGLLKSMGISGGEGRVLKSKKCSKCKTGKKAKQSKKGKEWRRKGKGSDHWIQISDDAPRDNVMVNAVAFGSNDGRSEPNVRFVTKGDRPKKKRGWLGVSISEVPGALAAQLDIEGKGILIANVVAGSPADTAGLTVHDIIISVDGEAIDGNTDKAVKLISMHKPGDEVVIELLRDGDDKTFVVELAARGAVVGEWKVDATPDAEIEDRVMTRARVLRKGPGGIWVVEDLGDLEELEGLPDNIKMIMPHSGIRSMNVFFGDGVKTITTQVEKDGTVLSVEGDSDGEIEVSRVDADGNETEKEYASADELKEADPEAYELWSQIDKSMTFKVDIDGLDLTEIEMPDFSFEFDTEGWKEKSEEWKEHAAKWHEHMGESLAGIGETHELAMKAVHEALEKVREEHGLPEGVTLTNIPHFLFERAGNAHLQFAHGGKPQHTFEVRPDGTIEVRIRKGGDELVRLYEDDDDLAKRSPKLYERYEDLMGIEVEDE